MYDIGGCPVCGSEESSEIADRDSIRREVELAWEFHTGRLKQPVPTKYLTDRLVFSQDPPLRLVSCSECSHLYRNPRETPPKLERTYAEESPSADVLENLFENQRKSFREQAERIQRTGIRIRNGLEVGSYVGAFLAAAAEAGLPFRGIDLNATVSRFAAGKNLPARVGSLDDLPRDTQYDAIVIWNTFEQLADVRATALCCSELLGIGGLLAVRVPNAAFYERWRTRLDGPYSAIAERTLAHNNLLGFPYRQGFSAASMERLLAESGFEIIAVKGSTLFPIADRWTTGPGSLDERITKALQRVFQRGWSAPWVEVYSRAV